MVRFGNPCVSMIAIALAGVGMVAAPASAQAVAPSTDLAPGNAPQSSESTGSGAEDAPGAQSSGEIVVTAQRRSERLVDVPISITAATGEQLQTSVIGSTRDLAQISPGLVTTANGSAYQPAIRGVTSASTAVGDDANVSLYVDDLYISNNVASLMDLMDVQRVEILKGPQGTLFGRNATGGAIRIITRDPTQDLTAEGQVTYVPRFKGIKSGGFLSAGLTTDLAASISGSFSNDDGIGYNINPAKFGERQGKTKSHAVRAKLLFTPNSDVRVVLGVDNSRYFTNVPYLLAIENGNNVFNSANRPGVIDNPGRPYTTNNSAYPAIVADQTGASLTGTFNFGDYTMKLLSQYRETTQLSQGDLDRTNLSISSFQSPSDQKLFTQEVSLNSAGNDLYNWTVGAFYLHQRSNARSKVFAGDYTNLSSIAHGTLSAEAIAGFGEVNIMPTSALTITLGGRYNVESKQWTYIDDFRPAGIRSQQDKDTWKNFTYRAIARYEFAPDSNVYASYSTGFKSGTYNTVTFPLNKVEPEKIKALEVGLKSTLAPGTFLTLAGYAYDYSNIQIQAFDSSPTALRIVLLNAATARIRGFEGQFETHPGIFNLSLGVSWIPEAKYVNFPSGFMTVPKPGGGNNSVAPIDLSNTRMMRTPKFTVNAAASADIDLLGGILRPSANILYNSGWVWWPGERLKQPSFVQLNAKVQWEAPGDRFNVFAYAENITGALRGVYEGTSNTGDAIAYDRPANVGIGAGFKF